MAKFRTLAAVDRAAIDATAKSELVAIGETVEITDPATIEKYVGNGTLEPVAEIGEAVDEPRVQQGETLEPGETGVLTQEGGTQGDEVVATGDDKQAAVASDAIESGT